MIKLICVSFLLGVIIPAVAQAPAGLHVWKLADLKAMGAKLAPKVDKVGVANETLAKIDGQTVLLVYRNAPGEAEFHEGAADFTIIHAGEGTLVLGGQVKGGRTTGPGEIRGASIEGGQSYPVTAGDVINIPAKTPHQMMVAKGKEITYMVVKVPLAK